MKFGEVVRSAKPDLVVSPRHEAWLPKNGNPIYSPEAIWFGVKAMQDQATPRDRRGSISASSLNSCGRKQQFTFIGLPEGPISPKTAQIFQNGTFMHIRWQMAGLTEGWLVQAEVGVGRNLWNLSGTQDGIAYEGSVVELKSINMNGFSSVSTFGPKPDHVFQVGSYLVTTGAEKGTIVYECKNTQEYREYPVYATEELVTNVTDRADHIWTAINHKKLIEPLSKCIDKTGYQYNFCPFRDHCLGITSWAQAEEIAA